MIRKKTKISTLTTIIKHSSGSPSQSNQGKTINNVIQLGNKESESSLFVDNIIFLNIENPKTPQKTPKLLEIINK